ncbi:hypothetical protein MUU72_12885 [Streptomyces sp. RS10V-4]|uniref:hypothetical protein n=1 Tax=Streptomyces rhizoryzae TaxID=2932493 RepID=UPI0020069A63|nr:hypothetical protein [Streptomyces rhizoryzae]MCK7623983.1 hypothetical protein [Streptomyces rhizoryzae]
MDRPRHRPRLRRPAASALAALAAAALAIPALSACSAVQKAMDCAKTATAVVNGVDKLQKAAGDALDDPQETTKALDDLDGKLQQLSKSAHDPELSKAVGDMNQAIKDARRAVEADRAPNLKPIGDAATRITTQCTPGDKE